MCVLLMLNDELYLFFCFAPVMEFTQEEEQDSETFF